MANRDIEQYRTVKPQGAIQAPQKQGVPLEQTLATIGQKIIAENQQSKIADNFSKAQLELGALNQEYQTQYQDDPFGGLDELKEKRQEIYSKYEDQISPLFRRDWNNNVRDLNVKEEGQTEAWAYKQTKVNTVTNINNSMKNNFLQANIDGQKFATGEGTEVDAVLNFAPSKSKLIEFGDQHLGEGTTTKMLLNYDKDYMKSFLAGVATTNPQKAAQLADSDAFKQRFSSQELGEFANIISKTKKQQELLTSLSQTQSTADVTDLVNDPSKGYYDKRLQIDQMDMSGAITPTAAAKARRVLSSQKDVDSITSTQEMSGVIQMIYDVNSQQGMNNADYLKAVQNIHELILEKQSKGQINSLDVQKLNNEMKTLTSKRVSDATKSVGNDFYEANQKFDTLPPEYRGEATRQLFYATTGKQDELTPDAYKKLTNDTANKVIDQINSQRRAAAVKAVNKTTATDDEAFLKTKGYTMDDVRETAKIHNTSEADVIRLLRGKK